MKRVALIGYGYWGPSVARHIYANEELKLDTICDSRQSRIDLAKKVYAGSVRYSNNIDKIMADNSIDIVAVVTGTNSHYSLVKRALIAGKHVYVEKPFTDDVQQALELKQLAEDKGLCIHVDHIMVYHPAIRKMKEIINSGELGDIIWFDASRLNLGPIKDDINSMWDLSVHDLSIIDYITNGANVKYVKAMGTKVYSSREVVTLLTIQYNGFLASLRTSWISPIKERKIIIVGTKKMIVYDDVDVINKLIVYDKGFDVQRNLEYADFVVKSRSGEAWIPKLEIEDALYNSIEHFRKCIVEKKASLTGPDAAARVIKVLELANQQLGEIGACSI